MTQLRFEQFFLEEDRVFEVSLTKKWTLLVGTMHEVGSGMDHFQNDLTYYKNSLIINSHECSGRQIVHAQLRQEQSIWNKTEE